MKGLIWYINKLLGREPKKQELTFAQLEMRYFIRRHYGDVGRYVTKGTRFKRPYKKKKKLEVGETEVIGRFYSIVNKDKRGYRTGGFDNED